MSIKATTIRLGPILQTLEGCLNQRYSGCLLLAFACFCVGWMPSLQAEALESSSKKTATEKQLKIDPRHLKAKYFTGEVVKGYAVNLTFKLAHCPNSSVGPELKKYESETYLNSAETGKPTPVRIVHLYVFENALIEKCSVQGGNKYVEIYQEIVPDLKRMTHFYITMGENISVESLASKKASE